MRGAVAALAGLATLAGCATATPEWREQNTAGGLVLTQTIEADAGERFRLCNTLENRGPRRAYILGGIDSQLLTHFYATDGAMDAPRYPPGFMPSLGLVPPPLPSDIANYTDLEVGAVITECGSHRYESAGYDVFVVQSQFRSSLYRHAVLADEMTQSIARGTHEAPLLGGDDQVLYSNRCRVDRRRKSAICNAGSGSPAVR